MNEYSVATMQYGHFRLYIVNGTFVYVGVSRSHTTENFAKHIGFMCPNGLVAWRYEIMSQMVFCDRSLFFDALLWKLPYIRDHISEFVTYKFQAFPKNDGMRNQNKFHPTQEMVKEIQKM